ncbi:hypothetical protein JCM5353_004239 [Sporobolomyces roseus]
MTSITTIAVIGSKGHQGRGVVERLLSTTDYFVRAISSNPSSDKATSLVSKYSDHVKAGRFEVVEGNLNDPSSLEKALQGAYGVFAAFAPSVSEGAIEENPEVVQGKNLVDAAKTAGIKHFVYSSLPSLAKITNGKRTEVFPFETKALVEEYARKNFENSTFLIPGGFFSNLENPLWAKRRDDGVFVLTNCNKPESKLGWVDEAYDMGTFAAGTTFSPFSSQSHSILIPHFICLAIFKKGPSITAGKTYPVNSEPVSASEFAKIYEEVTGERAEADPLPFETTRQILNSRAGEKFSKALMGMFQHLDDMEPAPYTYGTGYIDNDTAREDLGVKASSPAEFLKRTGWRAPPVPSA